MPGETELLAVERCLNFFASVIKSGESWSATCEAEFRAAKEALNTRATPALPEERAKLVENLKSFEAAIRSEVGQDREDGCNAAADMRERRADELAATIAFIERMSVAPLPDEEAVELLARRFYEARPATGSLDPDEQRLSWEEAQTEAAPYVADLRAFAHLASIPSTVPDEEAVERVKLPREVGRSYVRGANGQWVDLINIGGRKVEVDAEIALIVRALNDAGLQPVASCSGHGHRPGIIALSDGREIIIARDFDEARRIERLFPLDINGDPTAPHPGHVLVPIEVLEPLRAAYDAYVNVMQNFSVTGATSAERRFSEGEREDTAKEVAHEALAAVTFEHLYAANEALAAAPGPSVETNDEG